ncbi:hypothetical protein C1X21_12175 [Pseudomonas sp. FW305-3-2-15-A-LB2]|nr:MULTISPECIES: hypothetical protein [unclassified Pseudomonas]PMV22804.1 hypothetical protein C1X17_14490 [Pseudomonas sp. FW305-3-2-15-C-TSA2]PMV29466.1 hypothetical protein C1X22_12060 [Pseudomonas sp. DP16D-L5]PMV39369.1 hypothetical protein C1X21_12175 [Pseudomonas sp. FW305-3-2-15-A-LB2]PMV45679.1 hypothetical protein C1X16_13705 [Pseudomonas sp. FW305-3-2-15-C-R2A1]PMV51878.1 hypothetical protein C1X18_11245 [Pseudomonas sp. FW305-3-2-15-C-LB1]
MRIFSMMFRTTRRYRCFVLLDAEGTCVAFKSCAALPGNGHWIEVECINLSWLGNPFPSRARIAQRA